MRLYLADQLDLLGNGAADDICASCVIRRCGAVHVPEGAVSLAAEGDRPKHFSVLLCVDAFFPHLLQNFGMCDVRKGELAWPCVYIQPQRGNVMVVDVKTALAGVVPCGFVGIDACSGRDGIAVQAQDQLANFIKMIGGDQIFIQRIAEGTCHHILVVDKKAAVFEVGFFSDELKIGA